MSASVAIAADAIRSAFIADDTLARFLDDIRHDIRRGSKRAYRDASHASIQEAEHRARRTPPVRPHWLIRRAPWAQHAGFILPRGRRRMRDWT
jgi:hypothetical protein